MNRSGYSENNDVEERDFGLWRGAVWKAMTGKRGQCFLRRILAALDSMEDKELEESVLVGKRGCCAMGAVAVNEKIKTDGVDPWNREEVANLFNINQLPAGNKWKK